MDSQDEDVAKAAARALQNIVKNGPVFRDAILEAGCIEKLADLLQRSKLNQEMTLKYVLLTYVIIRQVKPTPKAEFLKPVIEPLGLVLIRNKSVDILNYVGWTLLAIIESSAEHIPALMTV